MASCPRILAAAMLSTLMSSPAWGQALTFTRDDKPSLAGARGIAAADFNRDGWLDLAIANRGSNTVTILLNQGHYGSAFARAHDVPVGAGPFDITTADFNRDGVPDLAVTNADAHTVSILLGRAAGGFSRSDIAVVAGPRGIATADVNRNGRADLVVTGWDSHTVQVLLADGHGGFRAGAPPIRAGSRPQGVAVADINRDGTLDLVVAHASSGLAVLSGAAGPAFTVQPVPGASNLNVLAIGDFNQDGWPDVAAASTAYHRVAVYLGGESGLRFSRFHATGISPRSIIAADVDHDGRLDLITANRDGSTVTVLLGNPSSPGAFLPMQEVPAGAGSRAVVAADFNRDGRVDLATGNEMAGAATILWNSTAFDPAGFSFSRLSLGTPSWSWGSANQAWPADFNGDGQLDVVTRADWMTAGGRQLHVLLTAGPVVPLSIDHYLNDFIVDDFNDDGHADVLTWQGQDPFVITVFLGDGRGGFSKAPPTTANARLWEGSTGDLDLNGTADLVFSGYDPAAASYVVQVLWGSGDGTFVPGVRITSPGFLSAPRIADVNRDGKPDVIALAAGAAVGWEWPQPALTVWFGDGTGGLRDGWSTPWGHPWADALVFGDLDHDGYVDAVTSSQHGVRVSFGGASGFEPPQVIPLSGNWVNIAIADITLDGIPDLVSDSGVIFRGLGDRAFAPPDAFAFEGSRVHVADFTRDGLPDLLVATSHGAFDVIVNERNSTNRAPVVQIDGDLTFEYSAQFLEGEPYLVANGADPDLHALTYQWRDAEGTLIDTWGEPWLPMRGLLPGTHGFTVTAQDGRGGSATAAVEVTVLPTQEVVLWAVHGFGTGNWTVVPDPAAAGGARQYDANLGAPKVAAPVANPPNALYLPFIADPTQTYKLWIRMKADGNHWSNDSVWVQFSGAASASGAPVYRHGTTSGLAVNLEECSGCGISGWGWQDDGWGTIDRHGVTLRFPDGGRQFLVIQTREDGVSIDQVVLSSGTYFEMRPGWAKNDRTILRWTFRDDY
jgi:hypothetical protein